MHGCFVKVGYSIMKDTTSLICDHVFDISLLHSHSDQPTLFLSSPGRNPLSNDTFIVDEGRLFELLCLSRSDIGIRVNRVDMLNFRKWYSCFIIMLHLCTYYLFVHLPSRKRYNIIS